VHVEAGRFTLAGELHGTLDIQRGVQATIAGEQHGTVSIDSGAAVSVTGSIHGTTCVAPGAQLVIESGAKLAGTLANDPRPVSGRQEELENPDNRAIWTVDR